MKAQNPEEPYKPFEHVTMEGNLFQITDADTDDDFELHWFKNDKITGEMVAEYYKAYQASDYEDSFEEWMNENHPEIVQERVFVEPVYIKDIAYGKQ